MRRRSRRAATHRRWRRIIFGLMASVWLGVLVTTGVVLWDWDRPSTVATSETASGNQSGVATAASAAGPVRPVYRYSVVPGGVHTPDDVAQAITRDPVVAAHYADLKLDAGAVRADELREPLLAHVSYRMGEQVYWTSKKVRLQAGEKILTDGQTQIRARCGNAVSVEALGPARPDEPAAEQFDLPADITVLAGLPPPSDPYVLPPAPPLIPPAKPLPPVLPRGGGSGDPGFPRGSDAPLPIPEPGTLLLVGLGGAAGLIGYLRRRRHSNR